MSSGVVFLPLIRRMFSLRESCFVGGLLSGFFMGGIMNRILSSSRIPLQCEFRHALGVSYSASDSRFALRNGD